MEHFHRILPFAQQIEVESAHRLTYSALASRFFVFDMGRVIAVANQKGGVGKTTTATNLAASLAAAEVPSLLIDCDPQSNSTCGVGFSRGEDRLNTYDLLMGAAVAADALQSTEIETLLAIPAHKNLIGRTSSWCRPSAGMAGIRR